MGNDLNNIIKSSDLDQKFLNNISEIDETRSIFACFECGMCTSSCPVAEFFLFDPHQMTRLTAIGASTQILNDQSLRFCLTCRICQEFCPQDVDFIEFIKKARTLSIEKGIEIDEPHDGILSTITEIQAKNQSGFKIPSNIIPEGFQLSKTGKVAYFFGCLPILDVIFDYLNLNLIGIAKNAVSILNKVFGKPPVIIENIKCCGHDALWKGRFTTFKELAEHNVKEINKLGIETIITTCAECYRTLKIDYPKYVKNVKFEVIHLSEFIANAIKKNEIKFSKTSNINVTYHDPCRLGRHLKVYEPPREILNNMENYGVNFNEMDRNTETSPCCGVSCFLNCNDLSRVLQIDRLTEAEKIADIMLTTCPKCLIHYNCMLQDKKEKKSDDINIKISDLTNLIAQFMDLDDLEKK